MPSKWEYSEAYLLEQISAMRWLKEQGLNSEQIRELGWGRIDETDRRIHFPASVTSLKMNLKTGEIIKKLETKDVLIDIKGSGHEWFFLKSKFKCPWVFTKRAPKSWRKEKSRECQYTLEDVENLTSGVITPDISSFIENLDGLTKALEFGNIRVSIANITNPETTELKCGKSKV